jgi:hypothetical protein
VGWKSRVSLFGTTERRRGIGAFSTISVVPSHSGKERPALRSRHVFRSPVRPRPLQRDAGVIGLVGLAHMVSHFSQLILPPLFPWLKDAFDVSYTAARLPDDDLLRGSCAVQTASGFLVDRFGPRPILFGGSRWSARRPSASRCARLLGDGAVRVVAGMGNGVFHPGRLHAAQPQGERAAPGPCLQRARHHRQPGLGAGAGAGGAAGARLPLARRAGGRGAVAIAVLVVVWFRRDTLALPPAPRAASAGGAAGEGDFDFLRIPAVVDVLPVLPRLCRRADRGSDLRADGGAGSCSTCPSDWSPFA